MRWLRLEFRGPVNARSCYVTLVTIDYYYWRFARISSSSITLLKRGSVLLVDMIFYERKL